MKKIFIAFTIFIAVMICSVSCDKEQENRRVSNNRNGRTEQPTELQDSNSASLIFHFHRNGGWIGLNEKLTITADSTCYSISYQNLQTVEFTSYQTAVKTSGEQWAYLMETFDSDVFAKIQDGPCSACLDGFDETFSVTQNGETYLFYNGGGDEYYKQMQGFFDAIWTQAAIFTTCLSPSSGCSSFFVYKTSNNHSYNDIGISVTGNREKLNLSKTEQTFDLSKTNVQDLNVEIKKFTAGSHGLYCDCVFEGEWLDTWTSVSGTVRIKIVQDYEGDPAAYTINVIIENVVLKNDQGNVIIVNKMEFNNVPVGWLPG